MSDLKYAHAGYSYQDLLGAVEVVDVILGNATRVYCDTVLGGVHDRFDDLSVEWADGHWTRRQIKHQMQPTPLDVDTFARSGRKLLLSEVLRSIRSDGAQYSERAAQSYYTIYLRNTDAVDHVLTEVLVPADPDPGPSVVGTHTTRYSFDPDALWQGVHREGSGKRPTGDAWKFLRQDDDWQDGGGASGESDDAERLVFKRDEIEHLCERLVVEVNAPAMSSDFTAPGPLEQLLLRRLREEVGVGEYPNENRRTEDVAAALVAAAEKARLTHEPLLRPALLQTIALRTDYGSVSRRSPAVADWQVTRLAALQDVRAAVESAAIDGGYVVAEAPPGQGKSWVADQLRASLTADGWTVAEHYCFLNDSEEERDDRVASERVFGSLTERIAAEFPAIALGQRPVFSADEQTLMRLVEEAVVASGKPAALIIDGLDHVTRVRASKPGAVSASAAMAAQIAALEPMRGCVIVVLSQPGDHLQPLVEAGATSVQIPPMDRDEVGALMGRLGLSDDVLSDDREAVIDALFARSAGNPLYATYLCRELQRDDRIGLDLTCGSADEVLASIPAYDGDLEHYYAHLAALLDAAGQAAADTLTLVDFPLTVEELKAIQPGEGHRVAKAVRVLEPVLRTSPRGLAIYHESFARYLRRELEAEPVAMASRIGAVVDWLDGLGLFFDTRAFGSLLPLLAVAGRNNEVLEIVDRSFAVAAVGAGFLPSAIAANLAVAVRCAQREGAWPAVVRCLELMRGVKTYEQERLVDLDSRFVGVRIALFGGEQVADRMLRDGLVVMPPEAGVLMCAELDRAGFVAPWRPYLLAWRDEHDGNDGGRDPEEHVAAAVLRGQFRLLQVEGAPVRPAEDGRGVEIEGSADGSGTSFVEPAPVAESVVAQSDADQGHGNDDAFNQDDDQGHAADDDSEQDNGLPEDPRERGLIMASSWCDATGTLSSYRIVVNVVGDTLGLNVAAKMAGHVRGHGLFSLAFAEEMVMAGVDHVAPYGSVAHWAAQAEAVGPPAGRVHLLRKLGADQEVPAGSQIASSVNAAAALTSALAAAAAVLEQHSPAGIAVLLDAIEACRLRPVALDAVILALDGEGWYRCWLRFCVDLVRAEAAAPGEASALAMAALDRLKSDVRPFVGKPRAVDLSGEMDLIWATISRAVRLLDGDDWVRAIELLLKVGREITGSIRGEMGVPLPPDRTLTLALETAPEQHLEFLSELIRAEIERSGGRFYSDIAEFHLLDALCQLRRCDAVGREAGSIGPDSDVGSALLAVSRDARAQAMTSWTAASQTLLAYGFHKDITVYEVLDPLRSLNALDPARGLQRMVAAQDLAYRASRHTDGKETRHAPIQWLEMLAAADPVAHARLSVEVGLNARGARSQFEHMRHDLWTEHAEDADPVVSAVLAATLSDAPRERSYGRMLERLADDEQGRGSILQRAVTRGDEVAQAGSETSGDSAAESTGLVLVNEIASRHDLRQIAVIAGFGTTPRVDGRASESGADGVDMTAATIAREDEDKALAALGVVTELAQTAAPGARGAAALVRAWRRGAAGVGQEASRDALVEAYAAALTERLKTMIGKGNVAEVSTVLESLSEVSGLSEPYRLLVRIGELLAEADEALEQIDGTLTARARTQVEAAARALALAWTQARGDRGWLAFGGSDHMALLLHASSLSPDVAAEAVGIGVERRLVGPGYQTMGITKALVEACAAQALKVPGGSSSANLAFDVWDEAFAVISDRLPGLPGEEAVAAYGGARLDPPVVEPALATIDYAYAVSSFAGLSHPGKENLRRTLVALDDLAHLRPLLFTHALPIVLRAMGGAVVPLLLLSMLDSVATEEPSLLSASVEELRGLLASEYLVVRALARRLLKLVADEDAPMVTSDLDAFPAPQQGGEAAYERLARAASLFQEAPHRASVIHDQVDGFIEAVVELMACVLDDDQFGIDLRENLRDMGVDRGWPDALLLSGHVAEEALQKAAGSLRAVFASEGYPVTEPAEWENELAELLKLSPLPLMVERGRVPRPALPLPPRGSDPEEEPDWGTKSQSGPEELRWRSETVPWQPVAPGEGGPYDGWILVGYRETRRARPTRSLTRKDLRTYVEAGVELDVTALKGPDQQGPLASIQTAQWFNPDSEGAGATSERYIALAARCRNAGPFVDDDDRLGLPEMVAPAPELVEVLHLGASDLSGELVMCDEAGPALAHVMWRSFYSHSDYHMSYPKLTGSGLLLRPDLAEVLVELWEGRLTWRTWEGPAKTDDAFAEQAEE